MNEHTLPELQDWMKTPVELPPLPWPKDALEPIISSNTLDFHHGKHHKAYVDKTLELTKGTALEGKPLEYIIEAVQHDAEKKTLFNNAAQVWNHNSYWKCLAPKGTSKPAAKLREMIDRDFGSWEEFRKQLINAGVTQFGSGWCWLVLKNGKLSVTKTPNADQPWKEDKTVVLTVDVWEHAYYLDFQNRRQAHLEEVFDNLINWDYVLKEIEGHYPG